MTYHQTRFGSNESFVRKYSRKSNILIMWSPSSDLDYEDSIVAHFRILPCLVAPASFGALLKFKWAINDLPYTRKLALGIFRQCNIQVTKVVHIQVHDDAPPYQIWLQDILAVHKASYYLSLLYTTILCWCQIKLLLSQCTFCVHYTTMHQFTVLLHSKPHM